MLHVVLVKPQYPGNVGAVARAMLNLGVERLVLVEPCVITGEARDRAVHAQRVLDDARVVSSLGEVVGDFDYLAAFAGRVSERDRSHLRTYVTLPTFAPTLAGLAKESEVALVFGPEDDGLDNDDIARCDAVVTIPTSEAYRSMNLSHAVTVALYAVWTATPPPERPGRPASAREKELLLDKVEQVATRLHYPEHRVRLTRQALQRVAGRAVLTRWEYHRLMGVFTRAEKFLQRTPPFWAAETAAEEEDEAEEDDRPDGR